MKKYPTSFLSAVALALVFMLTSALTSCGGGGNSSGAVQVTGVVLDKSSLPMTVGESETLTATVRPDDAPNKGVAWESSAPTIASVTTTGDRTATVRALSYGEATITVKTQDGGKTASCRVAVNPAVFIDSITIPSTLSLPVTRAHQLTATILPDHASKDLIWESDAPGVASVGPGSGIVTGIVQGTARITAKARDGHKTSNTCVVTVTPIRVTSVAIQSTLSLNVNETRNLTPTVQIQPSDAPNTTLRWSSSNSNIASVDSVTGLITAVAGGTADIRATSQDGGNISSNPCVVTVADTRIRVTGVTLNRVADLNLANNQEFIARATVYPSNATDKGVTWRAVSYFGSGATIVPHPTEANAAIVRGGYRFSDTSIIVITADNGHTASFVVSNPYSGNAKFPTGITLNKDKLTLGYLGYDRETLIATVYPVDVGWTGVDWSSTASNVVGVTTDGIVVARSNVAATVTITAKTRYNDWIATCEVTVVPGEWYPGSSAHVAGYEANSQGVNVATLWADGGAQRLGDGSYDSEARSVYVWGDDVYAAGFETNRLGNSIAALWKNGLSQRLGLSDGARDSVANGVYVWDNDVYVVGHEVSGQGKATATLWKNGAPQSLSESGSGANSVYVRNGDVYIAGYTTNEQGVSVATLWINGLAMSLGGGQNAIANSVHVKGDDIYVTGYLTGPPGVSTAASNTGTVALLWKNGYPQRLRGESLSNEGGEGNEGDEASETSSAGSVFVSAGDVYVAGNSGSKGYFWKNNEAQQALAPHMPLSGANGEIVVTQIYVSQNNNAADDVSAADDIYLAGYGKNANGKTTAILWKNGVAKELSDSANNAKAYSVFAR